MFLQVREQSFTALVEGFDRMLADRHGTRDPVRARHIATIALAGADGLFIAQQIDAAAVDLDIEFGLFAEMVWWSLGESGGSAGAGAGERRSMTRDSGS